MGIASVSIQFPHMAKGLFGFALRVLHFLPKAGCGVVKNQRSLAARNT